MSKRRRAYGEGGIDRCGSKWRLRYRIGRRRFTAMFEGSLTEAREKLTELRAAKNDHVAPDKMTLRQWIDHWVSIGCPGNKKRREVGAKTLERYAELLRCHVVPTLGDRPLQQLQPSEIDAVYVKLCEKRSARTAHHVHIVLGACLGTAERTGKITRSPMHRLAKVPAPGEADHGMVLEEAELRTLIIGFKGSALFPIVATAAFTGARRSEVLALRWSDLDPAKKTLRIERAIEETRAYGLRLKAPKREDHKRTITIDDDLIALLLTERERHLRIAAGVPDDATVDLSLVKLPADALMFPNPPAPGKGFSFSELRNPRNTTKEFSRKATSIGFPELCLHDLRGTHETHLLDRGHSPSAVAKRCGHDPVTMLRSYAKRTRKADQSIAAAINELAAGILRG